MIGIYKITNKINGKIYIGQSWDIERRWKAEIKRPSNNHLKYAFQKNGIENFLFEVIKELPENKLTQILLDTYEEHYIAKYESHERNKGYNKTFGGEGGKRTDDAKKNISEGKKGVAFSDEHIKNLSLSHIGQPAFWKGKNIPDDVKARIAKTLSKKVFCHETNKIYNSIKEASLELKIRSNGKICDVCKGRKENANGYHFEYYDEKNI